MNIFNPRSEFAGLVSPTPSLKPRTSGITLWRPDIVIAKSIEPVTDRRRILPGEPDLRPEAIGVHVEAARSALDSLAETRQTLGQRAEAARARAATADSDRDRVAAVMETYRVQAALDDALRGSLRRLGALIDERSVR